MTDLKKITKIQFDKKLKSGTVDLKNHLFTFPVIIPDAVDCIFDVEGSVFTERVDISNASFLERVDFTNCTFYKEFDASMASFMQRANFESSIFKREASFKRSSFSRVAIFSACRFDGDVFFERTFFKSDVFFEKTQFAGNVHFRKSYFSDRADFTYSSFSDLRLTSFFSIKNSYSKMEGGHSEVKSPRFIFRHIYFPRKTIFTSTDLSHTDFQSSMIENIVFKDCNFSKTPAPEKRDCFYAEVSKVQDMQTSKEHLADLKSGVGQWYEFRINDGRRRKLDIGDAIIFKDSENLLDTHKVFITEKHEAEDLDQLFVRMSLIEPYYDFESVRAKLDKKFNKKRLKKYGVVAFGHRPFSATKFWENLEDLNRQMKKSLEDSHDWQKAADFYRGEMISQGKYLKHTKDKPVYRSALWAYGLVAGYGESVGRIVVFMLISLAASTILLHLFAPALSIGEIFEYNLGFFIPLFGSSAQDLESLNLSALENIAVMLQIIWYYTLWFVLALTIQRKFRR